MEKKTFFLFNPTSFEEDVFFLTYGKVDLSNCNELKNQFHKTKNGILMISDETDFDWFKYFVKPETKKFEVGWYSKELKNNEFYNKCLPLITQLLEKLVIEHSFLFSCLYLINQIISDIKNFGSNVWSNVEYYKPNNNSSLKDFLVVNNNFLFNLIHENYFRSCYGIIKDFNHYDGYEVHHLIEHLSAENFYFGEKEKKDLKFKNELRNGYFSLVIENKQDKVSYPSRLNFKIIKNNKVDYFSFRLHGDKHEVILDTNVFVMCDIFEKDEDRFYFVFNKKDHRIFVNLLNYIDNSFRFIWIDEDYFYNAFKKRVYNNIPNSLWKECSLYGINIKIHNFYKKYSDFGTDNDYTILYGDSKYSQLRDKKTLSVWHNPRGYSDSKNPGKYYDLDENVFEYFFNGNKYILINFDDIPYNSKKYDCDVNDLRSLIFHKAIGVPSSLLENTFILTSDYK